MKYLPAFKLMSACGLFILFTSCGNSRNQETRLSPAENSIVDTVPIFILRADMLKKIVELPGELIPYEQTDLYSKIPGFVRTMKVDIGDRVRKSQTLAVIEAPEVNSQYAQAESSSEAAKAKWTTSKDNYDRLLAASQSPSPGIVAPVDLVNSRNQMMADSASYEAVRKQARAYKEVAGYLSITAPFDGVIIARKTDPGALVGAGTMLLTVQDNRTLRLRVSVPEIYVAAAGKDRSITFTVDAWPEKRFIAVLTRKTETVDPGTRTELWEFDVDNNNHLLKAGVFAYARIEMERGSTSFIIPSSAIATTLERKFVIKVKNGKAQWVDVRQGMMTDAGAEIFGSLASGDTLLVKASDERKPGSEAIWRIR